MRQKITVVVFAMLVQGLLGCESHPGPTAPSSVAQPAPSSPPVTLVGFRDGASGSWTTELHDAHERVVQFNTAGELIWGDDGTRLPGYRANGNSIPAESSCACWLVVRFGTSYGSRRAYLTADYGHDNPGTMVDLSIAGGALVVSRTAMFVPGTHTLSGAIAEMTDRGPVPVADAGVWRLNEEGTGWQVAMTDRNGFYELRGLNNGSREVSVIKDGYEEAKSVVVINGDTRFDGQLVRR